MVLKFSEYIKEVSGTELVGPVGPAYGETRVQNKTINSHDTNVVYSDIDGKFYTIDDYNNLYVQYLKNGGQPIQGGFGLENIDYILSHLQQN